MKPLVSRARWILLAASGALCVGALLGRRQFPPGRFDGSVEIAALGTERDALRECDDRSLADWRRQVEAVRVTAWTEEKLAGWEARLGPAWSRAAVSPEGDGHFRRIEYSRGPVPLEEWPEFLRLIRELEQQPGLGIVGLELTAGGHNPRRFTRMAFTVRIPWTESTGNAGRVADPPRISGPFPPAPPGSTGALPSLRRPAAVGNVPASGPEAGPNINPQRQIP